MVPSRLVIGAVLFAVGTALTVSAPAVPAAVTQSKGKGAPKAGKANAFRVQVRHPGWRKFTLPNLAAAKVLAAQLRAARWPTVQIRQSRPGVFVVRAKMPRWQNRAVVTNRAVAQSLAARGRAQGFQARVVPVRR
jgi:hypothetical protein